MKNCFYRQVSGFLLKMRGGYDKYWGAGSDYLGENKLGQMLMIRRAELRGQRLEIDFVSQPPSYYIDKKYWSPLRCFRMLEPSLFMKRMRNLEYVPKECKDCQYLEKCRGGSRFAAKIAFNSFKAKDPLANYD